MVSGFMYSEVRIGYTKFFLAALAQEAGLVWTVNVGILKFQLNNIILLLPGRFECKLTSPTSIYSILLYVIFSIGGGFTLRTHIRTLNNFHIDFDDKITMYAAIVFLGFHFLPLIAFCEGSKMAQFYSSLKDFEVSVTIDGYSNITPALAKDRRDGY